MSHSLVETRTEIGMFPFLHPSYGQCQVFLFLIALIIFQGEAFPDRSNEGIEIQENRSPASTRRDAVYPTILVT